MGTLVKEKLLYVYSSLRWTAQWFRVAKVTLYGLTSCCYDQWWQEEKGAGTPTSLNTILSAPVEKMEVRSFYCSFRGGCSLARNKGPGCVSGTVAWPVETQSSNSSVWVWVCESVRVKEKQLKWVAEAHCQAFTCWSYMLQVEGDSQQRVQQGSL